MAIDPSSPPQVEIPPPTSTAPGAQPVKPARRRSRSMEILAGVLVLLILVRGPLALLISNPRLQTWMTIFVSVLVQATPFLVLGVLLSAAIAVYVPRSFWARALPSHPVCYPSRCRPICRRLSCRPRIFRTTCFAIPMLTVAVPGP